MKTMTLKVTRRDEDGNEIINESALKGACLDLECLFRDSKVSYVREGDVFVVDIDSAKVPDFFSDCLSPMDVLLMSIDNSGLSVAQIDEVEDPMVVVNRGSKSMFSASIPYGHLWKKFPL